MVVGLVVKEMEVFVAVVMVMVDSEMEVVAVVMLVVKDRRWRSLFWW